jgi:hypothetical protein
MMPQMRRWPKARPGIAHETHYDSAEDLLNALRPSAKPWVQHRHRWIFRGQADAAWTLQATAIRDPQAFQSIAVEGDASDWSGRRWILERMLYNFSQRLDRAGMPIPTPLPQVGDRSRNKTNAEPLEVLFPVMALAQHHGLPTLLLDWSRRAYVAAYFAAADSAARRTGRRPRYLAVWALRKSDEEAGMRIYQAPAWTNPNLRAQSGLFTLVQPLSGRDRSVEEYMAGFGSVVGDAVAALHRLILPGTEAPKLLRLLAYEGIDGASMFPGADGVVRAMRELPLWDSREGE